MIAEALADLLTARQTVRRAVDGHDDADLVTAARMIDRALRVLCPHAPTTWCRMQDDQGGRVLCPACGITWDEGA